MADQRFLRKYRIRGRNDFRRVYRRRWVASDDCLVVLGCKNGMDHPRLGVVVPRRVGTAVARNRWKRIIREAFRIHRHELPAGWDIVVTPRGATHPTLGSVAESLCRLAALIAAGHNATRMTR